MDICYFGKLASYQKDCFKDKEGLFEITMAMIAEIFQADLI